MSSSLKVVLFLISLQYVSWLVGNTAWYSFRPFRNSFPANQASPRRRLKRLEFIIIHFFGFVVTVFCTLHSCLYQVEN